MDSQYYSPQMDYGHSQATPQNFQYDYTKPTMVQSPQNQMAFQQDAYQGYCNQSSQVHDEFQKVQYFLKEDVPLEQWDGQTNYGDGQLLPPPSVQSMNYSSPMVFNNNNNDNNAYIEPQPTNYHPWVQMEPVAQLEAFIQPEPEIMPQIDEEQRKREKSKGYSAKHLANKKQTLIENQEKAGQLFESAKVLEFQNDKKEEILAFAVEHVLIPAVQDNNCNFDVGMYSMIEQEKGMIEEEITEEKKMDEEFQKKSKALKDSQVHLDQCKTDNANKETVPVYVEKNGVRKEISKKTIATRLCRANGAYETCLSDREAAINQYKIKRQQKISVLLDQRWHYFEPYIEQALNNYSDRIFQRAQWNGTVDKLNDLYHVVFKPG